MNDKIMNAGLILIILPCIVLVGIGLYLLWQDPSIPWWVFAMGGCFMMGMGLIATQMSGPGWPPPPPPPAPPSPPWFTEIKDHLNAAGDIMKGCNDTQDDERTSTEKGWSDVLNKESNRKKV